MVLKLTKNKATTHLLYLFIWLSNPSSFKKPPIIQLTAQNGNAYIVIQLIVALEENKETSSPVIYTRSCLHI